MPSTVQLCMRNIEPLEIIFREHRLSDFVQMRGNSGPPFGGQNQSLIDGGTQELQKG